MNIERYKEYKKIFQGNENNVYKLLIKNGNMF